MSNIKSRHMRHRRISRLRHSKRMKAFLDERATTLGGTGFSANFTVTAGPTVTSTGHGLSQNSGPYYVSGAALPSGFSADRSYWVNVVDSNAVNLCASQLGATRAEAISSGSVGTPPHTLARGADRSAMLECLRQSSGAVLMDVADLDDDLLI